MESVFFIFDVCCTPTLSCRGRRYPVSATPTRTLSVCVNSLDDPRGRGEHCSPAKYHKVTFLLSYFCVTKSTKSQQGGLTPSSFRTSCGVHELVARAMRGKCVRDGVKAKVSSFALTTTSTIPCVRTYHTKEPSRFVHALSARPLKVHWRACGSLCADGSNY